MLNDEQWTKLYSILLETGRIYNKKDHPKTLKVFYTECGWVALGEICQFILCCLVERFKSTCFFLHMINEKPL